MRAKEFTFHTFSIAGRVFVGSMSVDGPYISEQGEGVALGSVCSIGKDEKGNWAIFKYDDQHRLDLSGLSDDDIAALAVEFGIRIQYVTQNRFAFFECPAWAPFSAWVRKHPRISARFRDTTHYLPGWYDRAMAERAPLERKAA